MATDTVSSRNLYLMYDMLVDNDPDGQGLLPRLAESWEAEKGTGLHLPSPTGGTFSQGISRRTHAERRTGSSRGRLEVFLRTPCKNQLSPEPTLST